MIVGERLGDGGQVLGGGQDRRVVGVVRGAEEDRRRGRRDRRQRDLGAVAHLRVGRRVARLDLVAVHERHDRDGLRAGRPHRPATTTSVSSWAFAAYASHHARWKAQPENGVAHGVAGGEGVPRLARDVVDGACARRGSGAASPGSVARPGLDRRRTGRLRVEASDGHARMLHRGPRIGCDGNLTGPDFRVARYGTVGRQRPREARW